MRRLASLAVLLPLLLASPAHAIIISPLFFGGGGQSWTSAERAVVNRAISDWTSQFSGGAQQITVEFTFDDLGPSPLFNATGSYIGFDGDNLYPWSLTYTVTFNSYLFPTTSDPNEFALRFTTAAPTASSIDGLTLSRIALGEALGFSTIFVDSVGGDPAQNKFQDHVSINGNAATFDPAGLNVPLLSSTSITTLADPNDLMGSVIKNGQRKGISLIDDQILADAYGYALAPEPATALLLAAPAVALLKRRTLRTR
jgi:hypothetical protein